MKNILITLLTLCISIGSMAQGAKKSNINKIMVAYFSCTGNTKSAAQKLAQTLNADLFEIKPVQPYTSADLNWNDKNSRSSTEMKNLASRPSIKEKVKNIEQYDYVFIGFPIWWNLAPTIINTFIESYELNGKAVIPFATSGGNDISNSEKKLKNEYPQIKWKSGKLLNKNVDTNSLAQWLNNIK